MKDKMITEENQINLIKTAIKTEAGWKALAASVKNSSNPDAKLNCIKLLNIIGNNKTITINDISTNLSDSLVNTFEEYMEKI
jgi:hypothetical protein